MHDEVSKIWSNHRVAPAPTRVAPALRETALGSFASAESRLAVAEQTIVSLRAELQNLTNQLELRNQSLTSEQPQKGLVHQCLIELAELLLLVPFLVAILCLVCGALLANLEDWSLSGGWYYVISVVCGLANPIASAANAAPATTSGRLWAGVIGNIGITFSGMMVGYLGNGKLADVYLRYLNGFFGSQSEARAWQRLLVIVLQAVVFGTLWMLVFVAPSGAILALSNNWKFRDGFFYVLADVSGQPNPLVAMTPTSQGGIAVGCIVSLSDFVVSCWLMGMASNLSLPSIRMLRRQAGGGPAI